MVTDKGVEMVLHPKYINQVRNHKQLSFLKFSEKVLQFVYSMYWGVLVTKSTDLLWETTRL